MSSETRLRVNENGRVVIPASFRKALGISVGTRSCYGSKMTSCGSLRWNVASSEHSGLSGSTWNLAHRGSTSWLRNGARRLEMSSIVLDASRRFSRLTRCWQADAATAQYRHQ